MVREAQHNSKSSGHTVNYKEKRFIQQIDVYISYNPAGTLRSSNVEVTLQFGYIVT